MDDDNKQNSTEVEITDTPKRTFNIPSNELSGTQNGGSLVKWVVLVVVILLSLGGAIYFLRSRGDVAESVPPISSFTETEVISTPPPSPTPSSTPASFDRSKYTLRILNGTETSGLAASVSAKLKELGYKIEKTGNASNSAQTKVSVKPSLSELLSTLIKDLSSDFKAVEGASLKSSDPADAEIILGPKQ